MNADGNRGWLMGDGRWLMGLRDLGETARTADYRPLMPRHPFPINHQSSRPYLRSSAFICGFKCPLLCALCGSAVVRQRSRCLIARSQKRVTETIDETDC